jgi:CRP/FNR family transcriptional regulator
MPSSSAQPRGAPELEAAHPCFDCAVRLQSVCGVLESDELRAFRQSGTTATIEAGQTLFYEGDAATNVFNLTTGTLRLSKLLPDGRRQIAGFVFPGDFLGITMEEEHAFTAEAVTASELCRFPRARFDDFVEAHPHLERRLYALAAHELAAARQQLVLLGRKTAAERVASFLLMLASRADAEGEAEAGDEVVLPMSRNDIADYLGLRIETVSRELSALKAARLIQLTGTHRIRLVDRDRLEELAEG